MRHSIGIAAACGLALVATAWAGPPVIFGLDTSGSRLVTLDPATGVATFVVPVSPNAGTVGALAYDPATDTLYGSSTSLHSLFRIDYTTGQATLIGNYGLGTPFMHGVEWDASTSTLYGVGYQQPQLFRIDTATGQASPVGPTGFPPSQTFSSLAHDTLSDTLYISNTLTDTLHSIDRATGQASPPIGPFGAGTQLGLAMAFHPAFGLLAADNGGSGDALYRVDTNTGQATLIGLTGTSNLIALAVVGQAPPMPGCYADCDTGTGPGVLDIFDFLCFQNAYANNDPYACNCDTSTGPNLCDIFDFLCFQNRYDAGCGPQIQNVEFSQVDVDFETAVVPDSQWGSVDITYVGADDWFYVNVNVNGDWVIQNAPMMSTEGPGVVQTSTINFPLAREPGPVSGIRYGFEATNEPQHEPPLADQRAQVLDRQVLMRGGAIDSVMQFTVPMGPVMAAAAQTRHYVGNDGLPNQDCQVNGCAPAAISNSMQFLKAKHNLNIPNNEITLGAMKEVCGYTARGCPYPDWITMKSDHARRNWGITTTTTRDPAVAQAALARNCDVEMCNISHVAAVSGMVDLGNGKWGVWVKHDTNQGNAGGTKEELVILDTSNNSLWDGWGFDGGTLSEFIIECP